MGWEGSISSQERREQRGASGNEERHDTVWAIGRTVGGGVVREVWQGRNIKASMCATLGHAYAGTEGMPDFVLQYILNAS